MSGTDFEGSDVLEILRDIKRALEGGGGGSLGESTVDLFEKQLNEMSTAVGRDIEAMKSMTAAEADAYLTAKDTNKRIDEAKRAEINRTVQSNKQAQEALTTARTLQQQRKAGLITSKEYEREIRKTKETLSNLDITVDKNTKAEAKRIVSQIETTRAFTKILGDGSLSSNFKVLGGAAAVTTASAFALSKSMGSSAGSLAKSMQNGASGLDLGSAALSGVLDIGSQAASKGFKAAGEMGSAIPFIGGFSKASGDAAAALIETTAAVVKFGIELAKAETTRLIKSYNDSASAGAIFASGMGDMIRATADTGMTLDHFSTMVKSNSEGLANSGLTVSEGMGKLASVFKVGGKDFKNHFLNLGYTMEEGGDIVSTVMEQMAKAGKDLRDPANAKEIAERSKDYAESLRLISAITGKDAKAKMKEEEAKMQDLAWQTKLQGMSPEQQALYKAIMVDLPESQQNAFKQFTTGFEQITDSQFLSANNMSDNILMKSFQQLKDLANSNISKEELPAALAKIAKINEEKSVYFNKNRENVNIRTMAGISGVSKDSTSLGIAKTLGEEVARIQQYSPGKSTEALKQIEGVRNTPDQMQKDLNEVTITSLELAAKVQSAIIPQLGMYVKAMKSINDLLLEAVDALTEQFGTADQKRASKERRNEREKNILREKVIKASEERNQRDDDIRAVRRNTESTKELPLTKDIVNQNEVPGKKNPFFPTGSTNIIPSIRPDISPHLERKFAPKTTIAPDIQDKIKTESIKAGLDPNYLLQLAQKESQGKVDAKNDSGATGLFQFMPKNFKSYGINPNDPNNVDAQIAAVIKMTKQNIAILEKGKIEATSSNLALAHQQGGAGATYLLKNQNKNISDMSSGWQERIGANVGGSSSSTVGEFIDKTKQYYDMPTTVTQDGKQTEKPSAALGAILSGPSTGFSAMLHGTEAVVPLPDGKSIPVKIPDYSQSRTNLSSTSEKTELSSQNSNSDVISSLVRKVDDLLTLTQSNRATADPSSDQIEIMEKYLRAMEQLVGIAGDQSSYLKKIADNSY